MRALKLGLGHSAIRIPIAAAHRSSSRKTVWRVKQSERLSIICDQYGSRLDHTVLLSLHEGASLELGWPTIRITATGASEPEGVESVSEERRRLGCLLGDFRPCRLMSVPGYIEELDSSTIVAFDIRQPTGCSRPAVSRYCYRRNALTADL